MRGMAGCLVVTLVLAMIAGPSVADGKPTQKGAAQRPAKRCSAAGMAVKSFLPVKLPKKVFATREKILQAATSCDIPRLEKLATLGARRFDFSFGTEKRPGQVWTRREKAGHQILAKLVKILRLHAGQDGKTYVWPAAYTEGATEEDWDDLIHLFGDREVVLYKNHTGYTGPRTAITGDGEWLYFVDGD